MRTRNRIFGDMGEDIAESWLLKNRFRIIARNYLIKGVGELDVVARDRAGTIIFVEIKTMTPGLLKPEDQYSRAKKEKMIRACEMFLMKNSKLLNERAGWRMDLLAIELADPEVGGEPEIRHYQNI